jgi:hypothetical protein
MTINSLNQGNEISLQSKLEHLAVATTVSTNYVRNQFCSACIEASEPIPFHSARAVIDRTDLTTFDRDIIASRLFLAAAEKALPGVLPEPNSNSGSLLVVALYARQVANQIENEDSQRNWDEFASDAHRG